MKVSQEITKLINNKNLKCISFKEILHEFKEKSYGFILILLTVVSALPIPAAGYSTPFGIIIVLLGSQLFLNNHYPYMPKKTLEKERDLRFFKKFGKKILKFISFFEIFIRPRFKKIITGPMKYVYATSIVLCGLSMILPIPFTNTAPSLSILIIALGMTNEDGLFIILGIVASILSLIATTLILTIGFNLIGFVLNFLKMNLF